MSCWNQKELYMRFLVFTDLHYDAVPDGDRRLMELMKAAKEKEADFIINLGDTCYPKVDNQKNCGSNSKL